MSSSLDPDQARYFVGPDLGPDGLQKSSGESINWWNVQRRKKHSKSACITHALYGTPKLS